MKKYILISTDGIDIETEEFKSFEEAQDKMQKEYDSYAPDEDDDTSYIEEGAAFMQTAENAYKWSIISVQCDELRIPLDDDADIVANLCPVEEYPAVQCYLEKKNGEIWQDVALVRPNKDSQKVDVLVWADADYEDYTNKYQISQYHLGEE